MSFSSFPADKIITPLTASSSNENTESPIAEIITEQTPPITELPKEIPTESKTTHGTDPEKFSFVQLQFRGDTRHFSVIFDEGFKPQDPEADLIIKETGFPNSKARVCFTHDPTVVSLFPPPPYPESKSKETWVYVLHIPRKNNPDYIYLSKDLLKNPRGILDIYNYYGDEGNVASISSEQIVGAIQCSRFFLSDKSYIPGGGYIFKDYVSNPKFNIPGVKKAAEKYCRERIDHRWHIIRDVADPLIENETELDDLISTWKFPVDQSIIRAKRSEQLAYQAEIKKIIDEYNKDKTDPHNSWVTDSKLEKSDLNSPEIIITTTINEQLKSELYTVLISNDTPISKLESLTLSHSTFFTNSAVKLDIANDKLDQEIFNQLQKTLAKLDFKSIQENKNIQIIFNKIMQTFVINVDKKHNLDAKNEIFLNFFIASAKEENIPTIISNIRLKHLLDYFKFHEKEQINIILPAILHLINLSQFATYLENFLEKNLSFLLKHITLQHLLEMLFKENFGVHALTDISETLFIKNQDLIYNLIIKYNIDILDFIYKLKEKDSKKRFIAMLLTEKKIDALIIKNQFSTTKNGYKSRLTFLEFLFLEYPEYYLTFLDKISPALLFDFVKNSASREIFNEEWSQHFKELKLITPIIQKLGIKILDLIGTNFLPKSNLGMYYENIFNIDLNLSFAIYKKYGTGLNLEVTFNNALKTNSQKIKEYFKHLEEEKEHEKIKDLLSLIPPDMHNELNPQEKIEPEVKSNPHFSDTSLQAKNNSQHSQSIDYLIEPDKLDQTKSDFVKTTTPSTMKANSNPIKTDETKHSTSPSTAKATAKPIHTIPSPVKPSAYRGFFHYLQGAVFGALSGAGFGLGIGGAIGGALTIPFGGIGAVPGLILGAICGGLVGAIIGLVSARFVTPAQYYRDLIKAIELPTENVVEQKPVNNNSAQIKPAQSLSSQNLEDTYAYGSIIGRRNKRSTSDKPDSTMQSKPKR